MKIDFPAIKEWKIVAIQEIDSWLIPANGPITLFLSDLDIDVTIDLEINHKGYIVPIFYDVKSTLGPSYLDFDNWFTEFMMWQIIEFSYVMIENSIYFIGGDIFHKMLGPLIEKELSGYKETLMIKNWLDGQDDRALMEFDYRHVNKPMIGNGWIEFFIMGELRYNN